MAKYGATGVHKIHSYFSTSGGVLTFYRDNASTQFAFGESGTGLDVIFYGDTASAYVLWDESADSFVGASSAKLDWDGSASFAGVIGMSGSVGISGTVTINDVNMALSASTGTKIGTVSTQKLGFFGVTPVVQGAHTATSAITSTIAINVLQCLQTVGLMTATV